ncbi:Up-regulated during septation-domain-containing protein [Massariosphaeria phaeospora]|uniref:Up-regulated during septation-domain-containing protein n=1 Tax=Massariosphaeria phaeospora TaxID=100035 RepID=A0A7C8I8H9_9PLEO|nr:Up-regulated during septation-domain-containing protein [Massariosphaeria phaeospora]
MTSNGLRTQHPYQGEALSPRPLYDFPSPTSNYPSGIGGASPGFFPMAYRSTARFGSSVFIPPPEVFQEGRKGAVQENGQQVPRHVKKRNSEVLNSDPVAMHLLVETAIGDSQAFEILAVEEVEELKQEQKGLDARLQTVRKKFETETKIRDAAQSLTRLASKKDKGHQRGLSSRGSNAVTDSATSDEELNTSNRKTEDLARQLLEIESRMRLIDMRLLMHTAGVLQLTHNGPSKRNHNSKISNGGVQRPDSPASIYTYENGRSNRANGDDSFDERSLYRSPENLDSLMNALQNGTHHHSDSVEQQNQAISSMGKRLEELNERLRELIIQANPERNQEYSLPPQVSGDSLDASIVDRQLDFLDQGLRDMVAEQTNMGSNSASAEVEGRLEGINNQLYAMLSRTDPSGETILPPPETSGNGSEEQLSYMEESFYSIGQLQYSLYEQIDDLRARGSNSEEAEKYETAMTGLWSMMQAGEEDARERKRERRRMLADDPDADEELSPDEDYVANEQFSLMAFSSKVQWLFRRATSLKDKQSILLRQIKQQRELNSKSDAQKEAEFARLNEQIMATRSEKKNIEDELDRAMHQLRQFDGRAEDTQALQDVQQHNSGLEAQLKDAQERSISYEHQLREHQERTHILESQLRDAQDDARVDAATIQAELAQSAAKIDEVMMALRTATTEKETAEARLAETSNALNTKEEELRNLEGEVVRLTTELTFAKAELDGAYGTRAERAAESVANPTIKRELDELIAKNSSLLIEIEALKKGQDAASHSEAEARDSERNLKAELSGMAAEYEALTRDAIQNERDRDLLEANIDKLRDEKEALEMELSDERVKWLGVRSPGPGVTPGAQADMGATSIRMLREDFRKMMRDRTGEGLKALRAEQEERRKLEAVIRGLRKDTLPQKSNLSKSMMA